MSDRKQKLSNLLEKVEAGGWCHESAASWLWSIPGSIYEHAKDAFAGSLDAAKALHDVVLPGWVFDVTNDSAFVMHSAWEHDEDLNPQFQADNDIPARAWLIAILKTLIWQEDKT